MTQKRPATTRGQATLERLRERLDDGTWAVGTRLPGEHELAAELGVGRNTLREALRSLVNAGLLQARRGDGTYVINTDELDVALHRRISPEQRRHALEVRAALEIEAARLAATRATDEELSELAELTRLRAATQDVHDDTVFLRRDLDWHDAIARASHNPILLDLYLGLDRVASYVLRAQPKSPAPSQTPQARVTPETPGAPAAGGPQDACCRDTGAAPNQPQAGTAKLHRLDDAHDRLFAALLARDPVEAAAAAHAIIDASHLILDSQEEPTA